MKIEVGDIVGLNNGEVHKVDRMLGDDPDHVNAHGFGPFVIDEVRYHQDGRFADYGYCHIFSVKRIISRASDDTPKLWRDMTDEEKGAFYRIKPEPVRGTHSPQKGEPKLWRDMTDEEKGALLLAHREGAAIHVWDPVAGAWRAARWEPLFQDDKAYRVEPAATREPIKIQGPSGEILGSGTMLQRGGEWDFDSIEVEDQ